jgi:hypothetical protein
MKLSIALLASLLSVNLFACALDPAPRIGDTAQAIDESPGGPIAWDPSKNGAEDIWPAGRGIATAAVTMLPDPACHDGSTVLAVVRWDGAIAQTFQVRASDEAAFRGTVADAKATLSVAPDNHGGATTHTGSATAGPVNPPHPNV